jgi:hypothetical protein
LCIVIPRETVAPCLDQNVYSGSDDGYPGFVLRSSEVGRFGCGARPLDVESDVGQVAFFHRWRLWEA